MEDISKCNSEMVQEHGALAQLEHLDFICDNIINRKTPVFIFCCHFKAIFVIFCDLLSVFSK